MMMMTNDDDGDGGDASCKMIAATVYHGRNFFSCLWRSSAMSSKLIT